MEQMACAPQQVVVSTWDGLVAWDSATATAWKVPVLYIDTGTQRRKKLAIRSSDGLLTLVVWLLITSEQ